MNELRPLNSFDRMGEERKREMLAMQRQCLFLWLRYYCIKVVQKRVAIPSFIRYEEFYQRFFASIMIEYMKETVHGDGERFRQFIHQLNAVEFVDPNLNGGGKGDGMEPLDKEKGRDGAGSRAKSVGKGRKKKHEAIWQSHDRWATGNLVKYFKDTLREIDLETNRFINAKDNEPLKQECLPTTTRSIFKVYSFDQDVVSGIWRMKCFRSTLSDNTLCF